MYKTSDYYVDDNNVVKMAPAQLEELVRDANRAPISPVVIKSWKGQAAHAQDELCNIQDFIYDMLEHSDILKRTFPSVDNRADFAYGAVAGLGTILSTIEGALDEMERAQ